MEHVDEEEEPDPELNAITNAIIGALVFVWGFASLITR